MIKYFDGTVFNTGADILVNTVNTAGAMGGGLALEFKLRYPELEDQYLKDLQNNKLKIGFPRLYKLKDQYVLNFPTKKHWKNPSKLIYIEKGLDYISKNYEYFLTQGIKSIAFPKLGAGLGGLDWDTVNKLMVKYLNDIDMEIYICLDELDCAQGIEAEMLNIINAYSEYDLKNTLNLNRNQINSIKKAKPIKRFWHISKLKGIGKKSYETIYKYIYSTVKSGDIEVKTNDFEQLNFL